MGDASECFDTFAVSCDDICEDVVKAEPRGEAGGIEESLLDFLNSFPKILFRLFGKTVG